MSYESYKPREETCERCGEPVNTSTAVWLTVDLRTSQYAESGTIGYPYAYGQFAFGKHCAELTLKRRETRSHKDLTLHKRSTKSQSDTGHNP